MSRSAERQLETEELLAQCSDPERLGRRADKHVDQAALMRALLDRKEVEADIAAVEALEREIGPGECDGILSELRFRLARLDREIAENPQS